MVAALAVANVDASSTPSTESRGRLQNSKLRNIIPPLNKTLLKLQIIQFILLYHIYKKKKQA